MRATRLSSLNSPRRVAYVRIEAAYSGTLLRLMCCAWSCMATNALAATTIARVRSAKEGNPSVVVRAAMPSRAMRGKGNPHRCKDNGQEPKRGALSRVASGAAGSLTTGARA